MFWQMGPIHAVLPAKDAAAVYFLLFSHLHPPKRAASGNKVPKEVLLTDRRTPWLSVIYELNEDGGEKNETQAGVPPHAGSFQTTFCDQFKLRFERDSPTCLMPRVRGIKVEGSTACAASSMMTASRGRIMRPNTALRQQDTLHDVEAEAMGGDVYKYLDGEGFSFAMVSACRPPPGAAHEVPGPKVALRVRRSSRRQKVR